MIELKIDNKTIKVSKGTSLIEAARQNGINIPSLCYNRDLPHYSSCMVCMVRESGKFIPACSSNAEEGMNIDASSDEVTDLRKDALSLLLTEHRAECEAPCKNVCPGGYDIARINRLIKDNKSFEAYELIRNNVLEYGFACIECKAPCEKACRRKMIDQSISIRNILIFLYNEHGDSSANKDFVKTEKSGYFNSTIGKIEDHEKKEWLKECSDPGPRVESPSNSSELADEASNCMHCDCRALDNCRLRDLCNEYKIKNPVRLRNGNPVEKRISSTSGLIFENAKCIKCGLCVRVSTDATNESSLCFTGRGFMTLIAEPLTSDFDSLDLKNIKKAVDICPTGALAIED